MSEARAVTSSKAVLKRWIARFISLLLAVVVWVAVSSEETVEMTLTVPVVPYADRENLSWAGDSPGYAVIRVRGKARTLWVLNYFSTPEIRLPLSALPTNGEVLLRPEMVELPQQSDVRILSIVKPERIDVKVDRVLTRIVPIQPRLYVEPKAGYVVSGTPTAFPGAVEISGPASLLHKLDSIYTDSMRVLDAVVAGERKLELAIPKGGASGVKVVTVRYSVERLIEERFENVQITLPPGWESDPPWVSLQLSGPASVLTELRKKTIRAVIEHPIHDQMIMPTIELPSQARLKEIQPEQVRVRTK